MTTDPLVAQSLLVDLQVRPHRHPAHDGREPRLRPAPEPARSWRSEGTSSGHSSTCRSMIPLVASTLVWIGFLNTETGWLNGIIEAIGLTGPGLDQQRGLDLPGPGADRPVGRRQLHAHQHRRAPVRPDRAVRGGADRWRRRLDVVPADHDPADVADPALQPRHLADRDVPVLHPGVHDDERARRPEQRDAVHQPRAVPRGVRVQPDGLRRGHRLAAVRHRAAS